MASDGDVCLQSQFSIARLVIQPRILAGQLFLIGQSNSCFSMADIKAVDGLCPVLFHTKYYPRI